MTFFDKFAKGSDDLVTKGFLNDKEKKQERRRIEFNGKSKQGTAVSFFAAESLADGAVNGSFKIQRMLPKIDTDHTCEFEKDNVKLTFENTKLVDGLNVTVNLEANPADLPQFFKKKAADAEADAEEAKADAKAVAYGAALGFKYSAKVNDDLKAAVFFKASHDKKEATNFVEASVAATHECGGSVGFSIKTPVDNVKQFKEAAVGGVYDEGDLSINAVYKAERDGETLKSNIKIGALHSCCANTKWGVDVSVPVAGGDDFAARAALQRTCGDEQYKVRVGLNGLAAVAFSTKLGANADLSVSAEGNFRKIVTGEAAEHKISSKISFNV